MTDHADRTDSAWYVAAYRGRDVVNVQAFSKLRPGRHLTSVSWRGFRLFRRPTDIIDYGYAQHYLPWEIWRVQPTRLIGYEPTIFPDRAATQLRARSLDVIELMPAGFEFGPHGAAVRQLIADLARLTAPVPQDRDRSAQYSAAMTHLRDQIGDAGALQRDRLHLARTYLRDAISHNHPGAHRQQHPDQQPTDELLEAAIAGVEIPPLVKQRWSLNHQARLDAKTPD